MTSLRLDKESLSKALVTVVVLAVFSVIASVVVLVFKRFRRRVEVVVLEDDFDDGFLDASKWWVVGNVSEGDGVVKLACGDGEYSNITTVKPVDLSGDVEVAVDVVSTDNKETFLVLTNKDEASLDLYNIGFDKVYKELIVQRKVAGQPAGWYPDANRFTEKVDVFSGRLRVKLTADGFIEFYWNNILKHREVFQLRTRQLYVICSAMGKSPHTGLTEFDNFKIKRIVG